MPAGRPSSYSQATADEILERISLGEPLTRICQDEHMPSVSTVFNWEKIIDGFSEKVTRARECSADFMSYEIKDISDEDPKERIVTDTATITKTDSAGIQRNRLRIDTRIKLMQMLKRKTYADKSPGSDPENPLHIKVDREEVIAKLIGNRAATSESEPSD